LIDMTDRDPDPGLRTEHRDAMLLLTIDREARRNALDAATSAAIDREIERAESDPGIGIVVLTGTGDRAFCSGMDLKEAAAIGAGHGLIPGRGFAGLTERRRTKPLIVAVNGAAVAGGLEIVLAADLVVASEAALFGLPEVKRGMFAFAGGVQRLARAVPRAAALGMILTGEPLTAHRLYDLGLITEVVPAVRVLPRAIEIAQQILSYDRATVAAAKLLYDMAADAPIDASLRFGRAFGMATLDSAATRTGIERYVSKQQR
jgi:enoyl-CoA hydratase/carnithine racemase